MAKIQILFCGKDRYAIDIAPETDTDLSLTAYVNFDTLKELRARIDYIIRREAEIQVNDLGKQVTREGENIL